MFSFPPSWLPTYLREGMAVLVFKIESTTAGEMEKFRVMYFIVISLTNAHSLPVASGGFSTTTLSVGFHFQTQDEVSSFSRKLFASKYPRLRMSENDNVGSGSASEGRETEDMHKFETLTIGNTKRKRFRDIPSAANARAIMKKVNSSCSKLLNPPSILSSSRYNSLGTRWAQHNLSGRHRGVGKKNTPQNDVNRNTKDSPSILENASLNEGRPLPSYKSIQNDVHKGKSNTDSQIDGSDLSIPLFASSDGVSPSPNPTSNHSWQPVLNCLLPFDNQPKSHHVSSDEPSLFSPSDFSSSAIEGVLPVSELFYRSTQSMFSSIHDVLPSNTSMKSYAEQENDTEQEREIRDDEELPFSAEQSDRLATPGNKIHIRRNKADYSSPPPFSDVMADKGLGTDEEGKYSEMVRSEFTTIQQQPRISPTNEGRSGFFINGNKINEPLIFVEKDTISGKSTLSEGVTKGTKSCNKKSKQRSKGDCRTGRKMVRRGMEMLVGGEPINADPPQRSIELNYYRKHPNLWARAITTNSPDFGPLLYMHSAGKVEKESIGLFCEHFVDVTQKWGICSDDLKVVVSEHERKWNSEAAAVPRSTYEEDTKAFMPTTGSMASNNYTLSYGGGSFVSGNVSDCTGQPFYSSRELDAPKGFGARKLNRKKRKCSHGGRCTEHTVHDRESEESDPFQREGIKNDDRLTFTLGGELKFSLGVSRSQLEYGGGAFRRVLGDGIGLSINASEMGFEIHISKLVIVDVEGGSSDVIVQFNLYPLKAMVMGEAERAAKKVNSALASTMDDGKMAMTLADVARKEKGWPARIRDRIVEEFLFETEENDDEKKFNAADDVHAEDCGLESDNLKDEYDGPFGMEGDIIYSKDDIWLGGGNGGVFFDYSESNYLNSPFKGKLGPYLVDAAIEWARQNQPRVIAIGDVHGCIDELKALLRKCDYHPGDTIVFLGDLVCKGPDSLSVVQMAREVGAIGVRGNHDFEVVRWHQAIKSGADPPVIGSEHYYVASALNTADLKWMYSLPWFISSSHLNALFVHAGFVSGIRLAKQNPRLMMNMRSILPDGTVTSKFFNNWPWARLWDGPQTVFFGHDADRGLQQYEHAIGLDTGCVYGGKLTACILPERRLISVNAKREYFQYRRKRFD